MKHLPGFTLVEGLVLSVIAVIVASIVYVAVTESESSDFGFMVAPEYESARSQRQIADEMKRANDLLERQLEQRENENTKAEDE
jgi:hypothetical protein